MSAPDTNVQKQTRRHKSSLWGIGAAVALAAIAAIVFVTWGGVPVDDQATSNPTAAQEATQ